MVVSSRRRPPGRLVLLAVAVAACSTSPSGKGRAIPASVTTEATTTPPAGPTTSPPTTAAFATTVAPLAAGDLGASWHAGCPIPPEQLRLVKLGYWGFDDQPHQGALVVDVAVVNPVISVFTRLYDDHSPIRSMQPVDAFGGDDNASMAADNTSGFNCRAAVAPGPPQWSAHAYGRAIDVNPVENPYVQGTDVLPPAGAEYLDRTSVRPGMAVLDGPLIAAFSASGWSWGGRWSSPDYQHFSADGG